MSTVNGPIHSVPCPHCGKPNDYRPHNEQQTLDTGSSMSCDHCQRIMEIVAIRPVVVITVRKSAKVRGTVVARRTNLPPTKQPTTISPGQLKKLLKR